MLWHRIIICMYAKCIQVWWFFIVLRLFAKPTHSGHFRGFIVHFWWSQTSLVNTFARWIITNALTQNHNIYVYWMHSSMVAFYCVAAVCGTHSFWLFSRIYSAFFGGHKHLSQTPLHVESLQMLWHRIIICMYAECIQVWWLFIVLRLFARPTHSGYFRGFIVHFLVVTNISHKHLCTLNHYKCFDTES